MLKNRQKSNDQSKGEICTNGLYNPWHNCGKSSPMLLKSYNKTYHKTIYKTHNKTLCRCFQ